MLQLRVWWRRTHSQNGRDSFHKQSRNRVHERITHPAVFRCLKSGPLTVAGNWKWSAIGFSKRLSSLDTLEDSVTAATELLCWSISTKDQAIVFLLSSFICGTVSNHIWPVVFWEFWSWRKKPCRSEKQVSMNKSERYFMCWNWNRPLEFVSPRGQQFPYHVLTQQNKPSPLYRREKSLWEFFVKIITELRQKQGSWRPDWKQVRNFCVVHMRILRWICKDTIHLDKQWTKQNSLEEMDVITGDVAPISATADSVIVHCEWEGRDAVILHSSYKVSSVRLGWCGNVWLSVISNQSLQTVRSDRPLSECYIAMALTSLWRQLRSNNCEVSYSRIKIALLALLPWRFPNRSASHQMEWCLWMCFSLLINNWAVTVTIFIGLYINGWSSKAEVFPRHQLFSSHCNVQNLWYSCPFGSQDVNTGWGRCAGPAGSIQSWNPVNLRNNVDTCTFVSHLLGTLLSQHTWHLKTYGCVAKRLIFCEVFSTLVRKSWLYLAKLNKDGNLSGHLPGTAKERCKTSICVLIMASRNESRSKCTSLVFCFCSQEAVSCSIRKGNFVPFHHFRSGSTKKNPEVPCTFRLEMLTSCPGLTSVKDLRRQNAPELVTTLWSSSTVESGWIRILTMHAVFQNTCTCQFLRFTSKMRIHFVGLTLQILSLQNVFVWFCISADSRIWRRRSRLSGNLPPSGLEIQNVSFTVQNGFLWRYFWKILIAYRNNCKISISFRTAKNSSFWTGVLNRRKNSLHWKKKKSTDAVPSKLHWNTCHQGQSFIVRRCWIVCLCCLWNSQVAI